MDMVDVLDSVHMRHEVVGDTPAVDFDGTGFKQDVSRIPHDEIGAAQDERDHRYRK